MIACELRLQVYEPASDVYEYANEDAVLFEVSTDPAHPYPYLLAPKQYAEQEIDTLDCSVSIGTVDVTVIDVPEVPGDQTTGFMTARVGQVFGRRCRLTRWVNASVGWVVIADGPASAPRMHNSYAAYTWTIRDTRDTERKLRLFADGGYASIIPPSQSVFGWGRYVDADGEHYLLPAAQGVVGHYNVASYLDDFVIGTVAFNAHFSTQPFPSPPLCDTPDLAISDTGIKLVEAAQLAANVYAAPRADVLWRRVGDTAWNVARLSTPQSIRSNAASVGQAILSVDAEEISNVVTGVMLFFDTDIPEGFPTEPCELEVIVRSRAPVDDEYPAYVQGALGDILTSIYNGTLARAPQVDGFTYDPANLNAASDENALPIRFDADTFDDLQEQVLLRATESVDDARSWAQEMLYAPAGWLPTLDSELQISPLTRNRPDTVSELVQVRDENTIPAPNWQRGDRTVSAVEYSYNRYFLPDDTSTLERLPDGLVLRPVVISFDNPASASRYGVNEQAYDASAFSAIGAADGASRAGVVEQASQLAQVARFEVLGRYSDGAPTTMLVVQRSAVPNVRAGQWLPWSLSWLPNTTTGLRGSVAAAQVLSVRDDNCTWRTLELEGIEEIIDAPCAVLALDYVTSEAQPCDVTALDVLTDEPSES